MRRGVQTEAGVPPIMLDLVRLDRVLEILRSVRERPKMYFGAIDVELASTFLAGLKIGASVMAGVPFDADYKPRRKAWESRGLEYSARAPGQELQERGLSPDEIVAQLMDVEIEVWSSLRSQAATEGDPASVS